MYDDAGDQVWEMDLSIFGQVRNMEGWRAACPFRYPGQYEDVETGLYYNRFRYYDPEGGVYVSQDPILLQGGLALYSYVPDTNTWVDIFGLSGKKCHGNSKDSDKAQHGYEIYDKNGNVVKTGVSSGRIRKKDGKSSRAEKQVRDWNKDKTDPRGPYTSKVVKTVPKQKGARQKVLDWEQKNADKHRSTLQKDKHKRP